MADILKPYEVLYDYSCVPTIKKFALDDSRVRNIMGPFGCIAGDSLVITAQGLLRISDIDHPVHVLTWNAKKDQFQLSLSGGAFPKGKDYLYRISTQRGEFVAAGHHRVFCAGNKYRQVRDLRQGDVLIEYSEVQRMKLTLDDLLSLPEDGFCFDRKVAGSMDHYARSARQYGQQLLQEACICQSSFPKPTGVQILSSQSGLSSALRMDDLLEQSQGHSHLDQSGDQKRTGGSSPLAAPRNEALGSFWPSLFFLHTCQKSREFLKFLLNFFGHQTKQIFSLFLPQSFFSYSSPSLSEWSILSIEREDVKQIFWDMQILGTNNYITVDGTIHHNSGKSSGCVMEIIRRSNLQRPGPDGIRRSRWAIVRNTYNQLRDTTIKTFHDWFPPKIFGEWRVTDHVYIMTKFPNVHLEIIFRALDRPDQVSNLLSLEVTGAWFNEARDIPSTIIDAMDSRIGRFPSKRDGGASWFGMIFDTNPPAEDEWLYDQFEKIKPENWKIFKQPSGLSAHAENIKNLPKNYYKNLAKGKSEMYQRIYIHGQYGYIVSGKPVFTSFVDNVHVAPNILEPIKGIDVIMGFDFGLQPACCLAQLTPLGQLRILDELVSDGMGIRQFCENQLLPLLRKKYFGMNVMGYGDPSGTSRAPTDESTCFDILHSKDIGLTNIIPAETNAIMPRVGAVENFLNKMYKGEPGFMLSPNCHFLRKAMNGGYHYEKEPKSLGQEYKPMPTKNFSSHIADSLEMLCLYLEDKTGRDQRHKSFLAQIKRHEYRPASDVAGY